MLTDDEYFELIRRAIAEAHYVSHAEILAYFIEQRRLAKVGAVLEKKMKALKDGLAALKLLYPDS